MRLILHTAPYWLLLTLRAAAPKRSAWRTAEFTTLRLRLIKIAARVVEGAARIRLWLPSGCPDGCRHLQIACRSIRCGRPLSYAAMLPLRYAAPAISSLKSTNRDQRHRGRHASSWPRRGDHRSPPSS
jgi:hypothetical protein